MKCLVTKLNGSVNANLPMLGMYSVYAKATSADSHFCISVVPEQSVRIKSDIAFDAKTGDPNGPTATLASGVKDYTFTKITNDGKYFYVSCPNNGKENLYYISKRNTKELSYTSPNSVSLNVELSLPSSTLTFNDDLTKLIINQIDGDISKIHCVNLENFSVKYTEGKFPIEMLRNLKALVINGNNNKLELNISNLSGEYGSKLNLFLLNNTSNITGDILEWAKRIQKAGRTSGTVEVQGVNSQATIGDYSWGEKFKVITFSESGCTVTDKN